MLWSIQLGRRADPALLSTGVLASGARQMTECWPECLAEKPSTGRFLMVPVLFKAVVSWPSTGPTFGSVFGVMFRQFHTHIIYLHLFARMNVFRWGRVSCANGTACCSVCVCPRCSLSMTILGDLALILQYFIVFPCGFSAVLSEAEFE